MSLLRKVVAMKPEDFLMATTFPEAFNVFKDEAAVWLKLDKMRLADIQCRWTWFLKGWRLSRELS